MSKIFLSTLICCAVVLFSSLPCRGQLIDCGGVSSLSGAKVLLDDIVFEDESPGFQQAMGRLRFQLETALEELRLESVMDLKVLRCKGRRPSGEADFTPALVSVLDSRNVVLEVWGSIMPDTNSGTGCQALVGYALIPVRLRERASGVYEVEYQSSAQGSHRVLDIFRQAIELQAFTAISIGLHNLESKNYDRARAVLCRAESLLRKTRPNELQYVQRLGREVVRMAKQDPGYIGLLKAPGIGGCDGQP